MKVFKIGIGKRLATEIKEVEVAGDTNFFYILPDGRREAKKGDTWSYHKTYEEARQELIKHYQSTLDRYSWATEVCENEYKFLTADE